MNVNKTSLRSSIRSCYGNISGVLLVAAAWTAAVPQACIYTTTTMDRLHELPLDLAREILEATARKYRDTIPQLMLVSREVHSWIEPVLYEVIQLHTSVQLDLFARTVEQKSNMDVISQNVRVLQFGNNLGIRPSATSIITALYACRSARNVWLSTSVDIILPSNKLEDIIAILVTVRPERLRISGASRIFPHLLRSTCFRNLTHLLVERLELRYLETKPDPFPSLTHVIISPGPSGWELTSASLPVLNLLAERSAPRMVVIGVVLGNEQGRRLNEVLKGGNLAHDHRFVALDPAESKEDDWVAAYYGKADLFTLAEEMVKRREKEIV